jgi:hypothetical protein
MPEGISDLEFNQWRTDPVTRKILDVMAGYEAGIKTDWANQAFQSMEENAYWMGYIAGMRAVFGIETVNEGDDDESLQREGQE